MCILNQIELNLRYCPTQKQFNISFTLLLVLIKKYKCPEILNHSAITKDYQPLKRTANALLVLETPKNVISNSAVSIARTNRPKLANVISNKATFGELLEYIDLK